MMVRHNSTEPLCLILGTLVGLFLWGCEPEVNTRTFDVHIGTDVAVCTTDLTIESLAGTPCIINDFNALRQLEDETQVGCIHVAWQDALDVVPLIMLRIEGREGFYNSSALDMPVFSIGPEFLASARIQYFFIPNSTPEVCDAIGLNASCATIEGCSFGVGPTGPLEVIEVSELEREIPFTGQGANGECVYQTPDGTGLVHPEACDGRDNDCNGRIDDAPMCMPAPDPEPEPECEELRDCSVCLLYTSPSPRD